MTALGDLATTNPTGKNWLKFYKTAARQWNKLEARQRAAIGEMFEEVRREAVRNRQHARVRHIAKGEEGMPALYSLNPRVNGREIRVMYVLAMGAYCVLNITDGVQKDNGVSARNIELVKSVTAARWAAITHPEAFMSYDMGAQPKPHKDEEKEVEVAQEAEKEEQAPSTLDRPRILALDSIPRVGCGHLTAWLLRALAQHPTGKNVSLHELHNVIPRKLTYTDVAKLDHVSLAKVTAKKRAITCTITDFGREVAAMEPTRVVVTGDHSLITLFNDDREDPYKPGYIGSAITARYIALVALQVVTADGEYIAEQELYALLDKRDQVLVPQPAFYQVLRGLVQDGTAECRYVHLGGTTQRCQYRIKPAPAKTVPVPEPTPQPAEENKEEEPMTAPVEPTETTPHTIEATPQQSPLVALLQTAEDFCEALGQSIRSLPRERREDALSLLESTEDFIAKARGNG